MQTPKVSIITPVYNGEKFLTRCIESIIKQTYQNWELILVDDGSVDNSVGIIKGYSYEKRIRFYKNRLNKGISTTRNRAINASRGKYIALLDQDDEWDPRKLELCVAKFNSLGKEYAIVYSNLKVVLENGRVIEKKKRIQPGNTLTENIKRLLETNIISSPTVVIKKEVLEEIGLFDESILWGGDDYDLWLRIALKYKFSFIDKALATRHEHGGNYSANKYQSMQNTILMVSEFIKNNNLPKIIAKRQKSSAYYRFGIESLKVGGYLKGLIFILRSLLISTKGLQELVQTIKNKSLKIFQLKNS